MSLESNAQRKKLITLIVLSLDTLIFFIIIICDCHYLSDTDKNGHSSLVQRNLTDYQPSFFFDSETFNILTLICLIGTRRLNKIIRDKVK